MAPSPCNLKQNGGLVKVRVKNICLLFFISSAKNRYNQKRVRSVVIGSVCISVDGISIKGSNVKNRTQQANNFFDVMYLSAIFAKRYTDRPCETARINLKINSEVDCVNTNVKAIKNENPIPCVSKSGFLKV